MQGRMRQLPTPKQHRITFNLGILNLQLAEYTHELECADELEHANGLENPEGGKIVLARAGSKNNLLQQINFPTGSGEHDHSNTKNKRYIFAITHQLGELAH